MNNPVILLLDTDADNGAMLRDAIHPDHFEVRVVEAEAEALRVVEEEEVGLIFIQGALPLSMECIETWKSAPTTRAIPLVILATAQDLSEFLGRLPDRARPEHHLLLPLQSEDLIALIEHILGPEASWDSEPVYDAIPLDAPDEDTGDSDPLAESEPEEPAARSPGPPPPPKPQSVEDRIDAMARELLALSRRHEEITAQTETLEAAHRKSQAAWERERVAHSARVAELLEENAALKESAGHGESGEIGEGSSESSEDTMRPDGEEPTTVSDPQEWKERATRALHAARERVKREEEQRLDMQGQLESAQQEMSA